MAYYGAEPESIWVDLAAGGLAVGVGYGLATWAKATGKSLWPAIAAAVAGAGGLAARHAASNPWGHELLEAVGFGGLFGVGEVVAASTTTLGNVGPGTVPLDVSTPPASTTNTAAVVARARQVSATRPGQPTATLPPPPAAPVSRPTLSGTPGAETAPVRSQAMSMFGGLI